MIAKDRWNMNETAQKGGIMQRFVIGLTALLGISLLASSCTKEKALDKQTIYVALGAEPATLDPRFATDANGMRITGLLFNALVLVGPELKVQGDAAKEWEFKDNTFTFKLHPRLRFSNDRPVEKEDLLFSFAEFQSDKSPFQSALSLIEEVQVEGENDTGFIIHLKLNDYSAKFLNSDLPVVKILPKKEAGLPEFSKLPFGTGSLKLVSQDSNEIKLAAVKDHPIHSPRYKNLIFKIIRDPFTRFQKTLKGSIDIAQSEIAPSKVATFEGRKEEFQVFKYPGLSMSYILINLKDPVLSKLSVRQALAHAINREEIIKYKLEGLAQEATSILTPKNPYFSPDLANLPYEPSKARAVIDKEKLKGHSLTLKTSNDQTAVDNARVLGAQIEATGLKINLQSYEWGTFYGDIRSGNFQLATMRWIGALDPDIYRLAFHTSEYPPGRNRGRYANSTLDQLVEKGLKIADEEERIKHYQEVQKIILDDLAIIPLWYDQQVAIVHNRVKGYEPWQTSDFFPFLYVTKE